MTLAAPPEPTTRWRPHPLGLVAVVLAVVGAACALSGLLPRAETTATLHRILPLLLFLGTVIVLAELTAVAGCRAAGVAVPVTRFVLTSTILAVTGTLAAVGALLLVT